MSTGTVNSVIASCRPADLEPVALPASALESTAPAYLRDLRAELNDDGRTPAELTAVVEFDEDCSFAVQETADRVREYVRSASHLGASRISLDVTGGAAAEAKVTAALDAARERARREGVTLVVDRDDSS